MKKIIAILLSCILVVTLFVGCGNKKQDEPKMKDVIESVYNNAYINSSDGNQLYIHVKLESNNKTNKELSDEYNEICKKIFDKIQPIVLKDEKINEIVFTALNNNKDYKEADIRYYKSVNNDGSEYFYLGSLTTGDDFREKTQAEKDEENKKISEAAENFKKIGKENNIVEVPNNQGYFSASKLLDNIEEGNSELKKSKSSFELVNKDNKKIVKVNLIYKNKVLVVGIVKNIRNNIESAFKDQCDEIDLSITQENPMDVYECKYINGSWDKEVK